MKIISDINTQLNILERVEYRIKALEESISNYEIIYPKLYDQTIQLKLTLDYYKCIYENDPNPTSYDNYKLTYYNYNTIYCLKNNIKYMFEYYCDELDQLKIFIEKIDTDKVKYLYERVNTIIDTFLSS
jgi:hypothetical protein